MKRLIILVLLFPFFCYSQKIFSEEDLIAVVKKFHPVAKAASLEVDIMKANLVSSRVAFDPVVKWNNAQKTFDGTDYYTRTAGELKIPTWYGIDLYAGTGNISGAKINPDETKGKISYTGINIPLLQNMVMDKRRAALKTSKLLIKESEMQQRAAVNDLVLNALQAYWSWWQHFYSLQLVDSSLKNAERRFSMVKTAYQLGDRAAIDTIEALVQVQTFSLQKTEAEIQLIKSAIELSGFLWKENGETYELPSDAVPSSKTNADHSLNALIQQGFSHPQLLVYNYKLSGLRIEKELKFQSLLPDIDVKYQQLGKGYDLTKNFSSAFFQNNYRFGVSFSMPLRLSEGRGEYRKAKLKIEQTSLQQLNKQVQIQNKIRQYFAEWQQTLNQLSTQEKIISGYSFLQKGEEIKFFNGESSLFLLNAREQKTLEARQKLIELQSKSNKASANLAWSAGIWSN